MCLINDFEIAKQLHFGKKEQFICYKVLERVPVKGHYQYKSPYYNNNIWQNGINISNGKRKLSNAYIINNGIHVYRTKLLAMDEYNYWESKVGDYLIVKVIGHYSDIIGANDSEICFYKVKFERPINRPNSKKKKG